MHRTLPLLLLLACGRGAASSTPETTLTTVSSRADIEAHHGERVRLEGTVVRPEMALGPGNRWKGTALRLDDGTELWIDYAPEPPDAWAPHVGKRVVVVAIVWRKAPPDRKAAATGPHISEWGTPEPAEG